MTAVTYRASIDDRFLRQFLVFGWVKAENIESIGEEELKACVKDRASKKPKDHELGRVENVVRSVKMNVKMSMLEECV